MNDCSSKCLYFSDFITQDPFTLKRINYRVEMEIYRCAL